MKKKLIHIIVLSCRTATRLIEKKIHTRLSLRERILLNWHKGICDACRLYEKQTISLDKILKMNRDRGSHDHPFSSSDVQTLQQKFREKIVQ